jgi:hypothetical protein
LKGFVHLIRDFINTIGQKRKGSRRADVFRFTPEADVATDIR